MALRDDLLTPIKGDNPSGVNLRYDPVTDAIKEARREDLDVAQGAWKTTLKTADYSQVIKLAGDALAKRSKDLQIAVWLVDAHLRRDGFSSLAPSFEFLRNLLDQFWDTLYPEIEDDDLELRAAPLVSMGTKFEQPLWFLPITSSGLNFAIYKQSRAIGYEQDATSAEKQEFRESAIRDGKPTAEEFDQAVDTTPRTFYEPLLQALNSGLEQLQSLSDFCDDRFGDVSPSFLKTRTTLEEIAQQVRIFLSKKAPAPAPVNAPEPVPAPVSETVVVSAPAAPPVIPQPVQSPSNFASAVTPAAASPGAEPANYPDAVARTAAICRYLRENTSCDASAFLLIRAFRWGELRANSPNIEANALQPPPADIRAQLKQSFSANDWDTVLSLTEKAMELPCGRAWLDLQRYTIQALEQKGEYYAGVAGFVRNAFRTLLEEFPTLIDQTLVDETPAASPETRTWINEQVLSGQRLSLAPVAAVTVVEPPSVVQVFVEPAAPEPPIDARPPQLEPEEEQLLPDIFEEALRAVEANRQTEALDLISRQLESERSGRGRFRRRTQLAHLLMLGGHKQIAFPILERLVAEIEQRQLEEWERSEALAYPVELLIRCLDVNGSDPTERKQLYARLCQLDPVRALRSQSL